MDEPLFFGHAYHGPNACHTPIPNLAKAIAVNVAAILAVFPEAEIGDIEPLAGSVAGWVDQIEEFAAAFKTATGRPLAFVHADINWTNANWPAELRQLFRIHENGVKVGIIYNGNPTDSTNLAWTQNAEQRFLAVESDPSLIPDHAVLQTWMIRPDHMLPETQPGTMTYLVDRYVAPRARLVLNQASPTHVSGRLIAADGNPVSGQTYVVTAVDTSDIGVNTTRTFTGTVPQSAVTAIWAMRINAECSCSDRSDITVGPMIYNDGHQTIKRRFVKSVFVASQMQSFMPNSMPFPVEANASFRLNVSMRIPYSSRNSGYTEIVFNDALGKQVSRFIMPFKSATVVIGKVTTDADGNFSAETTLQKAIFKIKAIGYSAQNPDSVSEGVSLDFPSSRGYFLLIPQR